MIIRKAELTDLSAITEIYNDAIRNTTATFDTAPKTADEQLEWVNKHTGRFPVLAAEEDGVVTGWASLSPWSDRCAYSDTAEFSIYIHKDHRCRGGSVTYVPGCTIRVLLSLWSEGQPKNYPLTIERGFY